MTVAGAAPAHADAMPQEALNKYYQNCMNGESPAEDHDRALYCDCVLGKMKNWDEATFAAIADENAKSGGKAVPGKVEDIAKECLAEVLR